MAISPEQATNTDPNAEIIKILKDVNVDPINGLPFLMTRYFSQISEKDLDRLGLAPAYNAHILGDNLTAFRLYSETVDIGAVAKVTTKALRKSRKLIRAAVGEKVVIKGREPKTFPTGRACHQMMEIIHLAGSVEDIWDNDIDLDVQGWDVKGFTKVGLATNRQLALLSEDDENIVENDEKIIFETPLLANLEPRTNQIAWIFRTYEYNRNSLIERYGRLPETPHEIEIALRDEESRNQLCCIVEATYLLFGKVSGIPTVGVDGGKLISLKEVNAFQLLNYLSISRVILEKEPNSEDTGKLTELPFGNIKFAKNGNGNGNGEEEEDPDEVDIKGGIADLVCIGLIEDSLANNHALSMNQLIKFAAGKFNSQEAKYRRKDQMTGGGKEKSTKLNRSFRSLFKILSNMHQGLIFNDLQITIHDSKFMGGDGGWSEVFNADNLPDPKHIAQMREYLFLVATQLAWVEKWMNDGGEKFSLSVQEVVDHICRYELFDRIVGKINYQMPERQLTFETYMPQDPDQLLEWANQVFGNRESQSAAHNDLKRTRALEQLLCPELAELQVQMREERDVPESLGRICISSMGEAYLPLDRVRELCGHSFENVERAVYFEDSQTYVLFIRGENPLRIAINGKREFYIKSQEGNARGRVISTENMRNVAESIKHLSSIFENQIWNQLPRGDLFVACAKTPVSEGLIWQPDGTFLPEVQGKPIICELDVMTGQWVIKNELIKKVLDDVGLTDRWGTISLISALSTPDREVPLKCPIPSHNNTNTPGAHLHVDRDSGSHIFCYVCQTSIAIPGTKHNVEHVKLTAGTQVKDYVSVTETRERFVKGAVTVGNIFWKYDDTGKAYVASRGFDPEKDFDQVGYIPPKLSKALNVIVEDEEIQKLAEIMSEHDDDRQLNQISSSSESTMEAVRVILDMIGEMDTKDAKIALESLSLRMIFRYHRKGLVGWKDGQDRWGGRVQFPTYWFKTYADGYRLCEANFMARGIILNGERLHGNESHLKPFIKKESKKVGEVVKRATPNGLGIGSIERFMLDDSRQLVVFEGVFNSAAFRRFKPELKDQVITLAGVGFHQLISFLRWVGVKGDPKKPRESLNRDLEVVCLAMDFDLPGAEAYERNSAHLMSEFPGLKIIPVNDLLPPDVASVVPPPVPSYYRDQADGVTKLDMNDVLLMPQFRDVYGYK